MSIISCENLIKIYKTPDSEVVALQGLDLEVERGELMAIIGNSGSGKSTLLNLIGGLDKPTAGNLTVNGNDMLKIGKDSLSRFKLRDIGFVWQNSMRNLLPYLTPQQNVEFPMLLAATSAGERRSRASEMLGYVGLGGRRNSRLTELSGGELQRVAIATAMINRPSLLLADEPTGSVDSKTAGQIFDLFRAVNRDLGTTVVIVTHDTTLQKKVGRVAVIRDGRVGSELFHRTYLNQLTSEGSRIAEVEKEFDGSEQVEWVAMDRFGRIQLPPNILGILGLHGKRRVQVVHGEDGSVRIVSQANR